MLENLSGKDKRKKRFNEKLCPNGGKAGFTLLEVLVVIFIMGLLGSLALANFRQGEQAYNLSVAARKVVSDLRRVQNLAMSGIGQTGIEDDDIEGYGICFKRGDNSYIIFVDINGNKTYQPSDDDVQETVILPRNIKISATTPNPSGLDVFFLSPDPITHLNRFSNPGQSATVVLEAEGTDLTKTILITSAGLIQ
ncbi:MAG: prepilin-type N-terminal cleavage/methylation domain-containing protein [Candidatus Portnoybacteria bacterium]|jgi:prepilin-type N-terminal cleavage/methylation domain-containing protein|nr:prepilin-type N-terminal cleavage/methylation domain-containing protein [Candidatus Portnoybacteria bacterium]